MQLTTFSLSALSIASAVAQTVHVVTVGGPNGTTEFFPNNIKANVGDMVQFQFNPKNHTVTQSTFAQPCVPIQNMVPSTQGFFSGFMAVAATDVERPTFTIPITSAAPIWAYCSQAMHCQAGMVMVINENPASNSTLAAYTALAKAAPKNLAPSSSSTSLGSSSGSNTTVSTPNSPPSSSSGTTSSSSSGTNSGSSSGSSSASSSTTSGTAQETNASGATMLGASSMMSLVAVFVGLVLV